MLDHLPSIIKNSLNSDELARKKMTLEQKKIKNKIKLPNISKSSSAGSSRNNPSSYIYKYKLLPGNNGRVILATLRKRPWWHSCSKNQDAEQTEQPHLIWEMYRAPHRYVDDTYRDVVLNHIQNNYCLVAKKGLYFCIKSFCAENNLDSSEIIPKTFFLCSQASKSEIVEFMAYNQAVDEKKQDKNQDQIWIMKPASKTNCGFGIKVVSGTAAVLDLIKDSSTANKNKNTNETCTKNSKSGLAKDAMKKAAQNGWVVQAYMTQPLLVRGRKFDIRCYVLLTNCPQSGLKGYFFKEAYVRTSCKKYSLKDISDRETHLTNDAVQKHAKGYGKYEDGNKLSLSELQQCITEDYPAAPVDMVQTLLLPAISRLCGLSIAAAAPELTKSNIRRSFELLGYDYMVDALFRPILIEVNSNPCLEFACPLLEGLITALIEGVFLTAADAFFPPPPEHTRTKSCQVAVEVLQLQENGFNQIYPQESAGSESMLGPQLNRRGK